jgi:outer membrane protein assembly factor BamB
VLGLLGAISQAGDWPQWRYDAARQAVTADELPAEMSLQWVRQLPTPRPAWPSSQPSLRFDVSYTPVAAGKRLYVPSMVTDTVSAYDTETGELIWRCFADGPVRFAPIVHDGKVYFASDDGYLYCVSAGDGRQLWRYRGGPGDRKVLGNERLISSWPIRGAPVLHNGTIYFSASIWCFMGIFVHAVDAETGTCVWANSGDGANFQAQPHSGAISFAGFIPRGYLGVRDGRLVAPGGRTAPASYDLETGKLIEFHWGKSGGRAWQVYGDPLTLTAGAKQVVAADGAVTVGQWQGVFEGEPWSVLAADDKLFVVTTGGRICCYGARQVTPVIHGLSGESGLGDPRSGAHPERVARGVADLPAAVVDAAGQGAGYGVMLGLPSDPTAECLARATEFHWIVVDPDKGKIEAFRRHLTDAGLYGTRVSAHAGDLVDRSLPPYFADLVVAPGTHEGGSRGSRDFLRNVFRILRPYGGRAFLPLEAAKLREYVREARLANAAVKPAGERWSQLVRAGALPGAADWTHNYADAANSGVSRDEVVRAPLGLLWFGNGPPNDEVLPRHGHGPAPQVAAGRLFIEGPDMLRGLDAYTGRLLWQRQLPGLGEFFDHVGHQPGAGEIGSNYVSVADSVYVLFGDRILRLDPATGETLAEFVLPPDDASAAPNWGHLAVWEDLLVAGASPVGVTDDGVVPQPYASASRRLVAMDRSSGRVLWSRTAAYNFRHNNIAVAAGKVFCIDGMSQAKLDRLRRRGTPLDKYEPRLLALDVRTGGVVWSTDQDVFGTFLNYSAEYDVLLQAGSAHRDRAADEASRGMVAYRGSDGTVIWKNLDLPHQGPCLLVRDKIIAQGPAYSLLTGESITRTHPLTDQPVPWRYTRAYGCNTAVASQHLITFRSGAAGFYDLAGDGGTGNLGGFKSSCTSNLIVAGGLLNAPEYTRTCNCNYQNQTSLALVHDPQMELWTFNDFPWDGQPIRRVGINFGAPGDRRSDDGTLWLDHPSVGGPSPDIPVKLEPAEVQTFRHHSSFVRVPADSPGYPWVAASGMEGVRRVTLTLAEGRPPARKYTVRLHFVENQDVKAGERVFRVAVQGEELPAPVDIAGQAGQRTALVKQLTGIEATNELSITLTPLDRTPNAKPVLCGVEVVEETGPPG